MAAPKSGQKTQRRVLSAVFLTIFLDLVGFGMFIPVIPLIARTFGASDVMATSIASVYSLGTLLAVAILGRLSDRYGRRPLLLATVAVSGIAQAATAWATSLVPLTALRFLAGIAAGNISIAQACISDVTAPRERARSMALIGIAFGLGFSLGPALGALVSYLYPDSTLQGIAALAAALNLFNLIFVARRLPETHPEKASPEIKELSASFHQGPAEAKARQSWWHDLGLLCADKGFRIVLLLGFLQVFGFIGIEAILSLMLNDAFLVTESRQQYLAFMFLGIMLVLLNGGLSRPLLGRIGEVKTLNIGQLLLAVAMIGLPLVAPSRTGLYLLLAVLAAGSAFANPSLSSLTSRLAPGNMQGFAFGTSQTLGALARIVGPLSFGFLYQLLEGPRSLFVSAGLMLLGWALAFFGLRGTAARLKHSASPTVGSEAAAG